MFDQSVLLCLFLLRRENKLQTKQINSRIMCGLLETTKSLCHFRLKKAKHIIPYLRSTRSNLSFTPRIGKKMRRVTVGRDVGLVLHVFTCVACLHCTSSENRPNKSSLANSRERGIVVGPITQNEEEKVQPGSQSVLARDRKARSSLGTRLEKF